MTTHSHNKSAAVPFPVIVIDTREQTPYTFHEVAGAGSLSTERRKLETGDYSLSGFESVIAIERKTVNDFYQSITGERVRFENEVSRLSPFKVKAVVVEGRLGDVMSPAFYGRRISPASITGTVASWYVRYGVPFWFPSDRTNAEQFTFKLLFHFWNQLQQEQTS